MVSVVASTLKIDLLSESNKQIAINSDSASIRSRTTCFMCLKNSKCRIGSNSTSSCCLRECNGSAADRAAATLATEQGRPVRNLPDCRRRGLRGRPIRCRSGAHLGYCVEKTSFGVHCSQMTFVDTRSRCPKSGILLIRCYGKV